MEIQKMKISELVPYKDNVRIHQKRNLDTIKKSMTEFGQYKNIVVRKGTNEILCGNGTYEAAKALGWTELECNLVDVDDEHAKALMIVDNRSSDLSQNDDKMLLDLLKDFDDSILDLAGYTDDEVENMLKFQEGTLFEDEKKEKKPKEKKKEAPISADDQISIVIMGWPFVLADPDDIKRLKDLMDKFTTLDIEVKCETTFNIWKAITDVIENAVEEGLKKNQTVEEVTDMSIETDRG